MRRRAMVLMTRRQRGLRARPVAGDHQPRRIQQRTMSEVIDWSDSTASENRSCSIFPVTGNMQQNDADVQRELISIDEGHRGGARAVLFERQ